MAGKHVGGIQNTGFGQPGSTAQLAAFRPAFPGSYVDRAYAEARQEGKRLASPTPPNPHPAGSPANAAWALGGFFYLTNTAAIIVQTGNGA